MVNKKMTIAEIQADPALALVKDQLVYKMDFARAGEGTMEEIGERMHWNVDSFLGGINALIGHTGEPHWFEKIYSGEEIAADPMKDGVNLVFMKSDDPAADGRPYGIMVPGGGYFNVWNMSEGWPIAAHLNGLGYHCFVLNYRVGRGDVKFPVQLEDYAKAMEFIRDHNDWYPVKWDNYFTAGFSAGGHLVAHWGLKQYGYEKFGLPKPFCIYPVYAPIKWAPVFPDTENLWDDPANLKDYPPCYIAAAEGDRLVDPENSRILKKGLDANGIPAALEIGPEGGHGFAEGTGMCMEGWIERAVAFMQTL